MRFEVRKSGGPVCETCGATELVLTARTSDELAHDLRVMLDELAPAKWRLLARRRVKQLRRLHADCIAQLQQLTHQV